MAEILKILGDGLSIAALAIIASVSLTCWRRIQPDAKVPMQFNRKGEPTWRSTKLIALLFTPALAVVIMFLPTMTGLTSQALADQEAWMVFLIRAALAGAFAYAHVTHMKHVLELLEKEGQLRS